MIEVLLFVIVCGQEQAPEELALQACGVRVHKVATGALELRRAETK